MREGGRGKRGDGFPRPFPQLPDPEQLERTRVPLADHPPQPRVLRTFETRIALEKIRRRDAGARVELLIAHRIGDAERRHAALPLAEEIAHSTQAQILTCNLETIFSLNEDLQPLGGLRAHVAEQDAEGFFRAATDASAQLMQL